MSYLSPSRGADSPPWIGLTGKGRAGKDTFAEFLAEYGFRRVAFADPVREAVLRLDPLISYDPDGGPWRSHWRLSDVIEHLGSYERAKVEISEVRRLLQHMGTEVIRTQDSYFWVRQAFATADQLGTPIVFTDVRFPNEASAIEQAGGAIVRLHRPESELRTNADHASETGVGEIEPHLTIYNDGTLGDLADEARALVARIIRKEICR